MNPNDRCNNTVINNNNNIQRMMTNLFHHFNIVQMVHIKLKNFHF